MREKLNENPAAQVVVIGVLVVVVGFFLLHSLGGGGGESETASTETAQTTEEPGSVVSEPTAAITSLQLPHADRMPKAINAAYAAGETIVLLIYRPGGIDDDLTEEAAAVAAATPGVAYFQTSVKHIARYSEITGPLGVQGAPALIAISGKGLNDGGPADGSVYYGFRTAEDIRQAIVDARYHGPDLSYAPN